MNKIIYSLYVIIGLMITISYSSCSKDEIESPSYEVVEPSNTEKYVDLDLPSGTLWATCNVGAESPEEYGLYFAWGETTGYTSDSHTFDITNYKWSNGTYNNYTKYCLSSYYGTVDNKEELDSIDDAATVNWGSDWQMPTLNQIKELCNNRYTTATWIEEKGVYGKKITSKSNGKSIFLPAKDGDGHYWSRSLFDNSTGYACCIYIDASNFTHEGINRFCGLNVRPVRVQK